MAYEPPNGKKIKFNFTGAAYTPPAGNKLNFNFTENGETPVGDTQYLFAVTWESSEVGTHSFRHKYLYINPTGFNTSVYGSPNLYNKTQKVAGVGFNASAFGLSGTINKNKQIKATGFSSQIFGYGGKVYNLKQILNLNTGGINSTVYGVAYLQGGVRHLYPNGLNTSQHGTTVVINTKADQRVDINSQGINPPVIPNHNVSPRILYPTGILSWQFGTAWVQRNPSPKGFDTSSYGVAWVSHSPRYLEPNYIDAFNSGYPKVFDPTQKIYVTGANTVIAGGVFGDISARNTRRIIKASGFYSQAFSDWGVVESTRRAIEVKGFDSRSFGITDIYNKTPSIAPIGINSFDGLSSAIGYRIRTLKPSGWYQPKFGTHTLTKPPEIKPVGIYQNDFGTAWISNKTRSIYAGLGRESLAIGEITVWHFARYLKPTGIINGEYGTARVEHERRVLLAKGLSHSVYGNQAWLSHGVRQLSPSSITYPNIPNHRVGGTQRINVFGYVATLFGSRIIPESQSIYPQGFINPFGIPAIDLWKKYIQPRGFLSTGQEGGHRFGTHKFWNLRQYIEMYYDVDSGLTPPKWVGWTSVENKNKTIGAIGSNGARISEPNIENKARVLSPVGLNASTFSKSMIADRVRHLKPQGMESPYFSGWSAIYNASPVVLPQGVNIQTFGICAIANTRRYFNRIGNFESLEMGKPMIADRIRTLKFEQRYTISPPIIPLPIVDLYTRYIEEVGRFDEHQVFGLPILNIRWNKVITRWAHRDYFGDPILKNLTPELKQRGHNGEEFGNAFLRTQWRQLVHTGSETVVWGKADVAFRDKTIRVGGFNTLIVSDKLKVAKTGVPPYYPQYIWLDAVEIDGEQNDGHGITMPNGQVPRPLIKTNVIFASGFSATEYGDEHYIQSNGIVMEYGISMPDFNQMPVVTLKNRTISVGLGIASTFVIGRPRLSPHTIYAVMEAPPQAVDNHYGGNSHYVNSDAGVRPPGEVFGKTIIMLKHRALRNLGLGNRAGYGTPSIELKRRYIDIKGIQAHRMGWHKVGDSTQFITQSLSSVMSLFGDATLKRSEELNRTIRPHGFDALRISTLNWISHFHRTMTPNGFNSETMGTQLSRDEPFMWQGLRVGELVKGNYGGFDNQEFGKAWISNRIREVALAGFESFTCEYDYTAFDKRMRVIRNDLPIPELFIKPIGFDTLTTGVPNIKPAAHYIRPDGNADQFRKGAF